MMKLEQLITDITPLQVVGNADSDICGVNIDSRKVAKGHLFAAIRGTQVDGHRFIDKAIVGGATAILCETLPETPVEGVTYVVVGNTEEAIGPVATTFFGKPSEKLKLVGVTGTNGKTTIATLLYNMFRKMGHRCGLLSTVCNYIEDEALPTDHTTPDPIELNELLHRMVEAGCEYAFMECSSHAIHQHRIGGLHFAGGIFTNLTRDHMDYHKTVENYRNAKKAFFDALPREAFAIINADDKNGAFMVQNCKATVKTYSTRSMADFRAKILECHFEGMYLEIDGHEIGVQFIGKFNVSNLLAVYGTAVMLGKPADEVLNGKGKVITVCGAGGNRDKGKRPLMAQEAARQSDKLIITSDNPRFEEPQDIIDDMLAGLTPQQRKKTLTIVDRREAIRAAVMMAEKGDVVLVAGKGHENYQEVKGVKHHFDDCEVVSELFNE